jgi:hypothetical protein
MDFWGKLGGPEDPPPAGPESSFDIALPILTKALLHFPHVQHFTPMSPELS